MDYYVNHLRDIPMHNKPKATGSYIEHLVPAWIKMQEHIFKL